MRARYAVHKLIQDLQRDPGAAARFRADPIPMFDACGLDARERELLRAGTKAALIELGVHPNLQMKYFRIAAPPRPGDPGPAAAYLARLGEV
jgi:hypothetical protein